TQHRGRRNGGGGKGIGEVLAVGRQRNRMVGILRGEQFLAGAIERGPVQVHVVRVLVFLRGGQEVNLARLGVHPYHAVHVAVRERGDLILQFSGVGVVKVELPQVV